MCVPARLLRAPVRANEPGAQPEKQEQGQDPVPVPPPSVLCQRVFPLLFDAGAGQGGLEHSSPCSAWDHQRSVLVPGCGSSHGAFRLLGPCGALWRFSEGAFLGMRVWEMRLYPSLLLPEESECPSIIHGQSGCLGSQHTQTHHSTCWDSAPTAPSPAPPARDPVSAFLVRKTSGAGAGGRSAAGLHRVPSVLGARELPTNFSRALMSHSQVHPGVGAGRGDS